jgi:N-acetylglucosamine-6-phosphate deacetylase
VLIASDRMWVGSGPIRPGSIEVRDGWIVAVAPARRPGPVDVDLTGRLVVPGFVDIHNHGGGGAGFQSGDPEAVATAAAFHRSHGTTTLLASLISAPLDALVDALAALAPLVASRIVAGVHLEGPFLSSARCGAHPPGDLRPPRAEDLDRLLANGSQVVRMMTLAPELDGGIDAVRRLVAAGVVAAVGHTDADHARVRAAVDAGATVATHLCNGMPPIHHRAPGPVVACLEDQRVAVELIADGVHLDDRMLRYLATTAGAGRAVLITDAIAATGVGDGEYRLGSQRIIVRGTEARLDARAPGDGHPAPLAGSVLTLDAALARAVGVGIPLVDALAAVTTTPARAVGLDSEAGTLAVGRRADLVALDDDLAVRGVLAAGRWVGTDTEGAVRRPDPE